MGKTIDIGGRIHNPEVGNVVTGANEILDDTKNKKQDVINSEVDAALEELDANKQDNLTFDQTPTEDSTNPVTSGGVYAADQVLQQAIEAILALIPSAASALNQLADKSFVNSSIATASATFRGTYNLVSDLHLSVTASHQDIATALASVVSTADNNDYCFVQIPISDTSSDIRVTERYKFNGTAWAYEYDLNNSGFTAQQWEAINSGITALLVQKLGALPTAAELATSIAGKQDVLTFDNVPVSGSDNPVKSGGLYQLFTAIDAKFPSDASSSNKLVAENRLAAYVAAIIGALDASYNVTSSDGHVTVKVTQADGAITSVEVLTNDIASASALTALTGRVSTNETDIATLQALYNALLQSAPQIIEPTDTWPVASPSGTVIYRVIDRVNTPPQYYSDYMWNGTAMVLMATYNNAIDDEPTAGSDNLVKSGGVAEEIFPLKTILDITSEELTTSPAAQYPTGYAISYPESYYVSYPNCSLTNPITLHKGEIVAIKTAQYAGAAVVYKTTRPSDNYGTNTAKVNGKGTDKAYYIYKATEDTEYIGFGYITASGFKVFKLNSETLDDMYEQLSDLIDANKTEIIKNNGIANSALALQDAISVETECQINVSFSSRINIKLSAGDIIRIKCDTDTAITRYPTLEYNGDTSVDPSGQEKKYGSWYTFVVPQEVTKITGYIYQSLVTENGHITISIQKVSPLLLREKLFQFMNNVTLSDIKYTLAFALSFDFSDDGLLFGSYMAAQGAYNERSEYISDACMVVANLADIEATKKEIVVIKRGDVFPSLPGEYFNGGYPTGIKVIGDDDVAVFGDAGSYESLEYQQHHYYRLVTRGYTPSTDLLDADVSVCDLMIPFETDAQNPNGKVYSMETEEVWDAQQGKYVTTQESIDKIEHIWEVTGIEHPYRVEPRYKFMSGSNPQRCPYAEDISVENPEGVHYFYAPLCLGNESHALCKTLDLTHWIFVCDIPFNQNSYEEACVCFANNKIYALSRGNFGTSEDNKFSRIIMCDFDKLEERDNSNWSEPVVLHNVFNERPTMAAINNKIFVLVGNGQNATTDGITVPRGKKSLITFDYDLNMLTWDSLNFTYPILHFHLMPWSGQLWFFTSTDKRCFFANKDGDTRSEISFCRLDDKLLAM